MSDTARSSEVLDNASTQGLDQLFDSPDSLSQDSLDSLDSQDTSLDTQDISFDSQDSVLTVQEAAKRLKISPRTVLRRLNRGALAGYRVEGVYGSEWRVAFKSHDSQDGFSQDSLDSPDSSLVSIVVSSDSQDSEDDALVNELREQISLLRNEVAFERSESQRHLQAAVFRNGYLEAQLQAKDVEIKLLTDSQHKPGWWQRVKEFFYRP